MPMTLYIPVTLYLLYFSTDSYACSSYYFYTEYILCHPTLIIFFLIFVWAYGAMETHQTSDLRIAGSIPAMLVFLLTFFAYKYC